MVKGEVKQSNPFKVSSVTEEDFEKGPEVLNSTTRVGREMKSGPISSAAMTM